MNPVPSTFADVVKALQRTVLSLVGGKANVKIGTYNPARKSAKMYDATDVFIVSLGPKWVWTDGEAMGGEGDSIFIVEGQLFVEYWHRDERDEALLSDQFLTDPIFGANGPLSILMSKLNDDGQNYSTLKDVQGNSPLFRPLIFQELTTPTDTELPWRAFTLAFNCQFAHKP